MRDETAVVPAESDPMDTPAASACIGLKASSINWGGAAAQRRGRTHAEIDLNQFQGMSMTYNGVFCNTSKVDGESHRNDVEDYIMQRLLCH
jgi:hypothetical protein